MAPLFDDGRADKFHLCVKCYTLTLGWLNEMSDTQEPSEQAKEHKLMHTLAAGRIVKRVREDDCPTTPKFSNETLEDALLEVHRLFEAEQKERAERDARIEAQESELRKLRDLVPKLCEHR